MKRKRKLKKVLRDQVKSRDKDDPLVQQVIMLFDKHKSAKQIANELSVDLNFVYGIKNKVYRNIKNDRNNNHDITNNQSLETIQDEILVDEVKEDEPIVEKVANKRTNCTDDEVEMFAILYLEGNSPNEIADKTNRSLSSVYRGLNKYQDIDNSFKLNNRKKVKAVNPNKDIIEDKKEEIKEENIIEEVKVNTNKFGIDLRTFKAHGRLTRKGEEYVIDQVSKGVAKNNIANELHISNTTVSNVIARYNKRMNKKNNVAKEEVKIEEKKNDYKINTISGSKVKTVGLIYGRHEEIPADEFIFQEVSSNLMFDYPKQEKLCREFIEDLSNNGYTSLEVYVTGLGCITASLSKVAIEENFGLILKHYDKKTDSYKDQEIVKSSGPSSTEFCNLLTKYKSLNLVDDLVAEAGEKYHFVLEFIKEGQDTAAYICNSIDTIKNIMFNMINTLLDPNHSTSINVFRLDYNDSKYEIGKNVI